MTGQTEPPRSARVRARGRRDRSVVARGVALVFVPLLLSLPLRAQSSSADGGDGQRGGRERSAVIDTVVVLRQDLFTRTRADESPFLDLLNDLH
ncbi:MAG: hypothetical protein ACRELC_02200, partial [Gemmatimonadota bacterium]